MSDYWMDSDSALLIAQLLGGSAITKSYPSCIITAWVFQAPAPPFDAEWQIDYDCSGTTRWVRINATTGEYSNSGNFTTTVHNPNRANMPARPELYQSFPNPFNPTCTISFALPKDGFVSLTIVDISGREITRLISRHMQAGYHSQQLNANGETSGIYFSRLESAGLVQTKKLVLIK